MWPTLISFGPVAIHAFGVFLFLGMFFGGFKLWQKAKEEGWEETKVMDVWLLSSLAALVTGRLGFVFTHWEGFSGSVYKILYLTKFPGLSYEAAWAGGLGLMLLLAFKEKIPWWNLFEAAAAAVLIVEIFGHFGSFFAGTNLGLATDGWWGLAFPGSGGKVWPVQIAWAGGLFLGYLILGYWEKHYRAFSWYQNDKGEAKTGFVAGAYLVIIGLMRLAASLISPVKLYWWGAGLILAGGLILLLRSGITIKARFPYSRKTKLEPKRKKRGFDYA